MLLGPLVPSNAHFDKGLDWTLNHQTFWQVGKVCGLTHSSLWRDSWLTVMVITRRSSTDGFWNCWLSEFVGKGQTPDRAQTLKSQTFQAFHL